MEAREEEDDDAAVTEAIRITLINTLTGLGEKFDGIDQVVEQVDQLKV